MKKLTDLSECNEALRKLALCEIRIEGIEGRSNRAILKEKKEMEGQAAPLRDTASGLAKQLKAYYGAHRKELEANGVKSVELPVGRIGMRKSPATLKPIARWGWEKVLGLLDRKKEWLFIRVKKSVDKDAVHAADLNGDELKNLGMRVSEVEKFFFEWERTKVGLEG